ncbi:MAG: hypothetical protein OWT28_03955 [Firmicutes bacterium]|nr:hypothetical protein [Bacillota bacterium]
MLKADEVRTQLDELAQAIEEAFASEQTVSGTALIARLESLRKAMETSAPDVIGAYYGYLQIKEQFMQMKLRSDWAKRYAMRFFGWELTLLALLLAIGAAGVAMLQYGGADWLWLHDTIVLCAWWGAVGATAAALHALYMHRQNGTLTITLDAWLWSKQLLGGALGLLAGLALDLTTTSASGHPVSTTALPALTAFFAGFSERRFLNFLQEKIGRMLQPSQPASVSHQSADGAKPTE